VVVDFLEWGGAVPAATGLAGELVEGSWDAEEGPDILQGSLERQEEPPAHLIHRNRKQF
jgi:hypothetical protein